MASVQRYGTKVDSLQISRDKKFLGHSLFGNVVFVCRSMVRVGGCLQGIYADDKQTDKRGGAE